LCAIAGHRWNKISRRRELRVLHRGKDEKRCEPNETNTDPVDAFSSAYDPGCDADWCELDVI
jgi:hypothetical protein